MSNSARAHGARLFCRLDDLYDALESSLSCLFPPALGSSRPIYANAAGAFGVICLIE